MDYSEHVALGGGGGGGLGGNMVVSIMTAPNAEG